MADIKKKQTLYSSLNILNNLLIVFDSIDLSRDWLTFCQSKSSEFTKVVDDSVNFIQEMSHFYWYLD
jgi:hypothetical protein